MEAHPTLASWQARSRSRKAQEADLATLELAAEQGHIDLKYLDESGFCLWTPVSYSYSRQGEQKMMQQTQRRGQRLSILGLLQPQQSFEYALAVGSITSESYIKVMDWMAQQSQQQLQATGQLTVVV